MVGAFWLLSAFVLGLNGIGVALLARRGHSSTATCRLASPRGIPRLAAAQPAADHCGSERRVVDSSSPSPCPEGLDGNRSRGAATGYRTSKVIIAAFAAGGTSSRIRRPAASPSQMVGPSHSLDGDGVDVAERVISRASNMDTMWQIRPWWKRPIWPVAGRPGGEEPGHGRMNLSGRVAGQVRDA